MGSFDLPTCMHWILVYHLAPYVYELSHQLPYQMLSPSAAEVMLLFEVGPYLEMIGVFENNLTIIRKDG